MIKKTKNNNFLWQFCRIDLQYWLRVFCIVVMAFADPPTVLLANRMPVGDDYRALLLSTQLNPAVSSSTTTTYGIQQTSLASPPSIPSPFLRLYLMTVFTILAYIPQWLLGERKDYRMALRHGMAAGFTVSGVDHFVNMQARYLPMLPTFLVPYGAALVYGTGVTELAGALGLVVPLAVYRRLGLPNLRRWAGIGIALMLVGLTVANVNVALQSSHGQEFAFAAWTYWLRLCLQPLFILWALYVAEVIKKRQQPPAA